MNILKTKERGNLIVISGPSGAGKDSIINELKKIDSNIWLSISMTSREPRGREVDGVDYYFVTKAEFERRVEENLFLEYAMYNNNYYGTPKNKIKEHLDNGIDVILEIEIQGALKVKEMIPDAIFIFIMPPSMSELRKRLISRGTDNIDKIIGRFERAYQEINEVTKYNYVVINDVMEEAAKKVESILISERCRVDRIEDIYLNNKEEEIHELLMHKEFDNNDRKI